MVAPSDKRRVALITGGAGDLATVLSNVLLAADYEVHAPGRVLLNVTSTRNVETFLKTIPPVDLLVHTAGLCMDNLTLKMSEADFDEVLDVSLGGAFRICRAVLKHMSRRRTGHIVMIGSFSALSGPVGQANYAAAKSGLVGLTQSLAKEYGARNIRANIILPGFMETKMTARLGGEIREEVCNAHALGRFNTTAEVAGFIRFLDQSMPHTSGQIFNLDSRIHRWT